MINQNNSNKIKPSVREIAMEHGLSFLFNEELVMLILGSGTSCMPVEVMAEKIVEVLDDSDPADVVDNLLRLKGVGQGKALAVAAALELGKRRSSHLCAPIKSSSDVVPYVQNYAVSKKEHFLLLTLNGSHEIIQIHVVSIGTLNRTLIHPREIYGTAMREDAAAIIVCHNHPSGNCEPSEEDIDVTHNLERVGEIMGIELLDHIIVCRESYYSFLDNKMLLRNQNVVVKLA
ncbi:DNA repair protein RadC [Treponema bryantii]|uniref:DNA repair protein RadC n=1 Tax=Treponema bryantii TaxID=163 RepID=A0A1I3L715_9SPIR|nr:DNA repair protein RadC [Treponema bryantii]SFI80316.1 DNA repair protein RadC [Treponema bryantii]